MEATNNFCKSRNLPREDTRTVTMLFRNIQLLDGHSFWFDFIYNVDSIYKPVAQNLAHGGHMAKNPFANWKWTVHSKIIYARRQRMILSTGIAGDEQGEEMSSLIVTRRQVFEGRNGLVSSTG